MMMSVTVQRGSKSRPIMIALLVAVVFFVPAFAGDWPQWRGAKRDGHTDDFSPPQTWPKTLKEEWKVTVGVGHSSPLLVDGKIYVHARLGEEEVVLCLDAATGKQLWRSAYAVAYEMHPAAQAHGKGPKSTPVLAGNKLYTLGISGVLSCFDAPTGRLNWRKEFKGQYTSTAPLYGTAMSPVVDNGLCIVHVGGHDRGALTAFDAATGAVKWSYSGDGPAYSSPVVATLAGVRQVVTFTQGQFVGVAAATGKLLWKITAKSSYDTNSMTPVVYQETLIFSREDKGIEAIRVVKQGAEYATQEVWRNPDNELYMNSPVLQGNLLFGLSARKKGQLFCIDAETGKTLWQGPGRTGENAAILNTGKVLLSLTSDARLIFFKPSAKEYEPVAQYEVAGTQTWAHPIVAGHRILIKDETTLASLAISGR